MTELSRDLRKCLALASELSEFKQRLKDLYEVKTFVFQEMIVIPEEEIERLKANAARNREQSGKLEIRIRQLIEEREILENKINYCLPLYDRWVRVPKPSGFFLVQKTRIEKGTVMTSELGLLLRPILIIHEYNEKEERVNE